MNTIISIPFEQSTTRSIKNAIKGYISDYQYQLISKSMTICIIIVSNQYMGT